VLGADGFLDFPKLAIRVRLPNAHEGASSGTFALLKG